MKCKHCGRKIEWYEPLQAYFHTDNDVRSCDLFAEPLEAKR